MKINLLVLFLIFVSNGFSQNNVKPSGIQCMSERLASKFSFKESETPSVLNSPENNSEYEKGLNVKAAPQWSVIGSSSNIYGMLISESKPLQNHDAIGTLSFVYRKGSSYNAQPFNNSGVVVAKFSNNWGATWDSTCIWSDNTNYATSAQGAIYNPPGNTNLTNAYFVGSGPVTSGTNVVGNFYASKKIGAGNYNSTASQTLNAQQFIANTTPFPSGVAKHDYSRYSFTSTDDGKIRSLAGRYFDFSNGEPKDFRGAAIVKGAFNSGVFTWTSDTLMPAVVVKTNGERQLFDKSIMAWNNAGSIGYLIMIGSSSTAIGSNKGWQPIIYKTTNSGISWSLLSGIDFNDPSMNSIKSHLDPVNNSTVVIPYFNVNEGFAATVDFNGKLHIVSTMISSSSSHNDSLDYVYEYGVEKYCWAHAPGRRPYIYDFYGDGTSAWNYLLIDSMSSEAPGSFSIEPGYDDNPWSADPSNVNKKAVSDARIQLSRTFNGFGLLFSWAESDSSLTIGEKKWNTMPNIKAKVLNLNPILLSAKERITNPSSGSNSNIKNRASFYYVGNRFFPINCDVPDPLPIKVPFTVTNSNPQSSNSENKHWFTYSTITFTGVGIIECNPGRVHENSLYKSDFHLYPNPTHSQLTISFNRIETKNGTISILNSLGQIVFSKDVTPTENKIELDLPHLPKGIYFVKVKSGNTSSTKKLVIE